MSELLHDMEPPDLISLAKTVTSRLVEANSPVKALENILLHADSAEGVLMRRKITKELLFKHLNSKRVPIGIRVDKAEHVRLVIETWHSEEAIAQELRTRSQPQLNIDQMTTLRVENLPYSTKIEDLKTYFNHFGEVGDIYLPRERGRFMGYAFVRFYDQHDARYAARYAMEELERRIFGGRVLRITIEGQNRSRDDMRSRSRSRDYERSRRRSSDDMRSRSRTRDDGRSRRDDSGCHSRSRDDVRSRSRSRDYRRSRTRSRKYMRSCSRSRNDEGSRNRSWNGRGSHSRSRDIRKGCDRTTENRRSKSRSRYGKRSHSRSGNSRRNFSRSRDSRRSRSRSVDRSRSRDYKGYYGSVREGPQEI